MTYNDAKTVEYEKTSDSMYFKAGVYNQSNLEKYPDESPTSYGAVIIYRLKVTHDGASVNPNPDEDNDDE